MNQMENKDNKKNNNNNSSNSLAADKKHSWRFQKRKEKKFGGTGLPTSFSFWFASFYTSFAPKRVDVLKRICLHWFQTVAKLEEVLQEDPMHLELKKDWASFMQNLGTSLRNMLSEARIQA